MFSRHEILLIQPARSTRRLCWPNKQTRFLWTRLDVFDLPPVLKTASSFAASGLCSTHGTPFWIHSYAASSIFYWRTVPQPSRNWWKWRKGRVLQDIRRPFARPKRVWVCWSFCGWSVYKKLSFIIIQRIILPDARKKPVVSAIILKCLQKMKLILLERYPNL